MKPKKALPENIPNTLYEPHVSMEHALSKDFLLLKQISPLTNLNEDNSIMRFLKCDDTEWIKF